MIESHTHELIGFLRERAWIHAEVVNDWTLPVNAAQAAKRANYFRDAADRIEELEGALHLLLVDSNAYTSDKGPKTMWILADIGDWKRANEVFRNAKEKSG